MKFIDDLKKWYLVIFESGLILAMLLILSAFKFPTEQAEPITFKKSDIDIIDGVDVPITKPKDAPPKPPKPSVFNEVPNHKIIDVTIDELKIDWEGSDALTLPKESKEEINETIFEKVEIPPKLKGGLKSLYGKIKYPRAAKLAGIEGTVIVEFVVDTDGSVTNAKVTRSIGGGCDEEALEAVEKLTFTPGLQRGIAVKVRYRLPVIFRLR